MPEVTPPLYMDVSSYYSGDELGLPWRDIFNEGIVGAGSFAVGQTTVPSLSVDVAVGAGWVLGDTDANRQPLYRIRSDSVINKAISPDPTNPRKVLVVAQVVDETFAGTGRLWRVDAIHGTPAPGGGTEPALPASALPLALVDVTAADASIVTAQITDRRVLYALKTGGAYPSLVSVLPATPTDGDEVYFQNTALATAGIVWPLRYRAAIADAYKWEVVGRPPPLIVNDDADVAVTGTGFVEVGTAMRITAPLKGIYDVNWGFSSYMVGNAGQYVYGRVFRNGVSASLELFIGNPHGLGSWSARTNRSDRFEVSTAGWVLDQRHQTSGGEAHLIHRSLLVAPARVGA